MSATLSTIELLSRRCVERCSNRALPFLLCHQSLCVLDGLAARQASLLSQFTRNIQIWNPHCAPLILRSMIECFITFSWILKDPVPRSESYFSYGIGQARQFADVYNILLDKNPNDEALAHARDYNKIFVESFRNLAFVDVNLGSWSGKDIRTLAKEVDQDELYKTEFSEFSATTHNTFYHVAIHNMQPCKNEEHPIHLIKKYDDGSIDPDYFSLACKYFDMLINEYNTFCKISINSNILYRFLIKKSADIFQDDNKN